VEEHTDREGSLAVGFVDPDGDRRFGARKREVPDVSDDSASSLAKKRSNAPRALSTDRPWVGGTPFECNTSSTAWTCGWVRSSYSWVARWELRFRVPVAIWI
jgi:hypothetical protein